MDAKPTSPQPHGRSLRNIQLLMWPLLICVVALFTLPTVIWNLPQRATAPEPAPEPIPDFWKPQDITSIADTALRSQVSYGRELVAHTADYLGPRGSVAHISNGLNCQNCHLAAGTQPWGNNYGAVASTYPKVRARSGREEDIFHRVNDCFERSLNGQALDTSSRELRAIKAYIVHIGGNVPKGGKGIGSGLHELPYLDRAADPARGAKVYAAKCQSCHQPDGAGLRAQAATEYQYPPLWGPDSYNDGAGLYRISNFARFAKYNMPQGVTWQNPLLTDEEAWDVAAFVNSQPRPHKNTPDDWPDISKKPIDHPFGPYSDSFTELQHKFGPFGAIAKQ